MSTDATTTTSAEARKAAGRQRGLARMKEIALEDADRRRRLVADLIADLGRIPTALDRMSIENLAAAHVRAERLRSSGRSDIEERRVVLQAQRALGMKPAPAAPAKTESMAEYLERTAAAGSAR